jgi:hypothetical protein
MGHGSLSNIWAIFELLPSNLQDLRILDAGFGCGEVMHTMMSYGNKKVLHYSGEPYIIGIDIDPKNVSYAKKWLPIYREVYLYDATKIPYPTNIIKDLDIIICTEVVEHTFVKSETLKMIEYLRDLAPLIIFTCPEGNSLSNKKGDYEYHNTIWYESDFKKLGFNTKLVKRLDFEGQELKWLSNFVKFINLFRIYNKTITNTIVAWKST